MKIHFLCFAFLKLSKLEIFFKKQDFYIRMKEKTDLLTSNNLNGESHEKIVLKSGMLETGGFSYAHLHKRKLLLPSTGLFLLELHSHCC